MKLRDLITSIPVTATIRKVIFRRYLTVVELPSLYDRGLVEYFDDEVYSFMFFIKGDLANTVVIEMAGEWNS